MEKIVEKIVKGFLKLCPLPLLSTVTGLHTAVCRELTMKYC